MFTMSTFQFIQNQDICKSFLSIVLYGLDFPIVSFIAFTMNTQHARGLFAKECITMCAELNIKHFKQIHFHN